MTTTGTLTSSAVVEYLAANRERHLAELIEFASFASISSRPESAADVRACADWLAAHLRGIGLAGVELLETTGHPIVIGEWMTDAAQPTVIVYGHYDVQPVAPLDEWLTAPFAPEIRDGFLFARGASDNKGQLFANIKAVEALLAVEGTLPCNLRFVFEGEEEWRSEGFDAALDENSGRLAADLAIVSDVTLFDRGVPSITLGLRGFVAMELTLTGPSVDLHSGLFGGVVLNPAIELGRLLASAKDPANGRILVEGFYEGIEPVSPLERESWQSLEFDPTAELAAIGVAGETGELDYSYHERVWSRPTLEVNGFWSGFITEGLKTIIPSTAHAKVSCRLVPGQQPQQVLDRLREHFLSHVPKGVTLTIDWELPGSPPFSVSPESAAVAAAKDALRVAFGSEAKLLRSGWSVPAAEAFSRILQVPCLLLGFGSPADNAHAPNESYLLDDFDRGIRTMTELWPRLAERVEKANG